MCLVFSFINSLFKQFCSFVNFDGRGFNSLYCQAPEHAIAASHFCWIFYINRMLKFLKIFTNLNITFFKSIYIGKIRNISIWLSQFFNKFCSHLEFVIDFSLIVKYYAWMFLILFSERVKASRVKRKTLSNPPSNIGNLFGLNLI